MAARGMHGVDEVVAAGRLADEERPLPGGDELRPRRRGQDVDVERPQLLEQGAELLDVLFDPVGVHAFEDDHEVGEGALP